MGRPPPLRACAPAPVSALRSQGHDDGRRAWTAAGRDKHPRSGCECAASVAHHARPGTACWPCRQRKVKCDNKNPCENCVKREHPQLCSYKPNRSATGKSLSAAPDHATAGKKRARSPAEPDARRQSKDAREAISAYGACTTLSRRPALLRAASPHLSCRTRQQRDDAICWPEQHTRPPQRTDCRKRAPGGQRDTPRHALPPRAGQLGALPAHVLAPPRQADLGRLVRAALGPRGHEVRPVVAPCVRLPPDCDRAALLTRLPTGSSAHTRKSRSPSGALSSTSTTSRPDSWSTSRIEPRMPGRPPGYPNPSPRRGWPSSLLSSLSALSITTPPITSGPGIPKSTYRYPSTFSGSATSCLGAQLSVLSRLAPSRPAPLTRCQAESGFHPSSSPDQLCALERHEGRGVMGLAWPDLSAGPVARLASDTAPRWPADP